MNLVAALACGILFGVGLAMSGMTDIERVIGFFDVFGDWDPSLAFVMGGGLLISLPFFQLVQPKLKRPVIGDIFRMPTRTDIDTRLVGGAALFGIGWGVVGLCPGPVIAALAHLDVDIIWVTLSMLAGMLVADQIDRLLDAGKASRA
jgi:uncharacterized membrane protein YedE/YeeE